MKSNTMARSIVMFRLIILKRDTLTRTFSSYHSPRKPISALYIPGSRASETFSYFSPYLDLDEKFENVGKTQEEIKRRGMDLNVTDLKEGWDMFKMLMSKRQQLESNIKSMKQKINQLTKLENCSAEQHQECEGLKIQVQINSRDSKSLLQTIWEMEENFIPRCLKLPATLHEKTPEEPEVLETFGEVPKFVSKKDHIEIGSKLGLLEYKNHFHIFLYGKAALFEQGLLNLAGQTLLKRGFIRTSGVDFSRSSVVEGCGLEHEDPNSAFILKNIHDEKNALNPLHLVGNASLLSFLTLNTKIKFNPHDLPVSYFGTGRRYTPKQEGSCEGLYDAVQESVVQAFGLAKNDTEYNGLFDTMVNTTKQIFGELDIHYRITLKSAKQLKPWESLRAAFEVWSCYKQCYVEVGHVAMHSDYFSKRLLIVYQTPSGRDFPQIVSGTLISVPKLLGCFLENEAENFRLQEAVERHVFLQNAIQ